jgi:hypothetical protein
MVVGEVGEREGWRSLGAFPAEMPPSNHTRIGRQFGNPFLRFFLVPVQPTAHEPFRLKAFHEAYATGGRMMMMGSGSIPFTSFLSRMACVQPFGRKAGARSRGLILWPEPTACSAIEDRTNPLKDLVFAG